LGVAFVQLRIAGDLCTKDSGDVVDDCGSIKQDTNGNVNSIKNERLIGTFTVTFIKSRV
jgi:hypothetical protein